MTSVLGDKQGMVLAGVVIYLVAMLVIGVIAARKANTSDNFMVAGRNLSLWLCTATIMATWMGAATVIGAGGAAYESGLIGVIADPFGAALCLFLAGLFFVRMLRRLRLVTIIDLFTAKFGRPAGMLASVALFIAYIGWTGSQLVAFGLIIELLTGISTTTGIIIAAVIVLSYTTAGGMWAVALTDMVQVAILCIGLVLMVLFVLDGLGGWSAVAANFPDHAFRMIPLEHSLGNWIDYLRAWAILGVGSIATQDLLQRAFSSRNEQIAQNGMYLAGIGYLTFGMIPVLLGIIGAAALPGLDNPEFIVTTLAIEHLPGVIMMVFIGALLAAIMSSADSALLAPASILAQNIVPFFKPDLGERARLAWARYSVPVIGAAALAIALEVQAVYSLMLDAFSVTLVALIVPTTAAIWWRRSNPAGGLAAMIAGILTWIGAAVFWPDTSGDMLGMLVAAATILVVTPLTQKISPPTPLADVDGAPVPMRNRLGLIGLGGRGADAVKADGGPADRDRQD